MVAEAANAVRTRYAGYVVCHRIAVVRNCLIPLLHSVCAAIAQPVALGSSITHSQVICGSLSLQNYSCDTYFPPLQGRMDAARALFHDASKTQFVIVTIPTLMAAAESARLAASLRAEGIPLDTLIVNQVGGQRANGQQDISMYVCTLCSLQVCFC